MFWQIFNFLFGWQYVHLSASHGMHQLIRRVRFTHEGRPYVKWFTAHYIYLDREDGWTITALTDPVAMKQTR